MYEFTLEADIEDMDEGDLRSTLDEFMAKHEENIEAFEAAEAERDSFSEAVEDLEDEVADLTATTDVLGEKFAEIVADASPLFDADEVAGRFSLDELVEKADSLGAFSLPEEAETDDETDEPEEGPTFSDKPEKAPVEGSEGGAFREEAEQDLASILGSL